MISTRTISVLIATIAVLLAGCGGGGMSSSAGGGTLPLQPPASMNSATVALQAQSTSVPLPPITGYSGTITMPSGSGMVTIVSAMQPPAGIPVPSGITPMMYVSFTASGGAVSMNQAPGFDMDMMSSSMMGSQSYYMAQYLNGAWSTVEGPATMSGTSMMMNPGSMPIALQAGQQTCFAYYSGAVLPTPMPSMMP